MSQLPLFPENIEVFWSADKKAEISQLEAIAREAAKRPLLFGEERNDDAKTRYQRFERYIRDGMDSELYLIKDQGRIIGAAYIWDGWIPEEIDYVKPEIELAFIEPKSQIHEGMVIKKLLEAVARIKENRD